ncbi:MAG TPA: pilus assembly protein PilM [Tepidisphaeraceae bacterium]|jgi:type IV pilus assembly protein PilM
MRYFVQSWFSTPSSPIGVDFGSDCLRVAQVEQVDNQWRLTAAASADVPPHVRNEPFARFSFFTETIRELLTAGNFRGRRVMLNLPASFMYIQHLRLPKMDDESLKKALTWETRGKFPFDPSQASLRHVIAGEIYHDQEPKYEVVVMAARRELVEQFLAAAAKAKLDVAGINVEPKAIIDCYSRVYRRKADLDVATMFADIGCSATRVMIARGGKLQFARSIPIGGENFSRAAAQALEIPLEQARVLRARIAAEEGDAPQERHAVTPAASLTPAPAEPNDPSQLPLSEENSFALLSVSVAKTQRSETTASMAVAPAPSSMAVADRLTDVLPSETSPSVNGIERQRIEEACREPIRQLVDELSLCRRYYEATFPNQPVSRLIFVGGEANQRGMCQSIARNLGIAAQIGDPLSRMNHPGQIGIESGIDRRRAQPAWSVAIGLSMGQTVQTAETH